MEVQDLRSPLREPPQQRVAPDGIEIAGRHGELQLDLAALFGARRRGDFPSVLFRHRDLAGATGPRIILAG
jgi:hypothetical protein